ncbi:hypothetical protein [Microbispora hainanensis]|uniref:Uncharacterized protein n=1 Tax=Microbispora hainanensis TaxID=568844 RepID=A0ABZ1SIS6_9ACTN|nr:hypothetical protein [Microbispora hainanensis]
MNAPRPTGPGSVQANATDFLSSVVGLIADAASIVLGLGGGAKEVSWVICCVAFACVVKMLIRAASSKQRLIVTTASILLLGFIIGVSITVINTGLPFIPATWRTSNQAVSPDGIDIDQSRPLLSKGVQKIDGKSKDTTDIIAKNGEIQFGPSTKAVVVDSSFAESDEGCAKEIFRPDASARKLRIGANSIRFCMQTSAENCAFITAYRRNQGIYVNLIVWDTHKCRIDA